MLDWKFKPPHLCKNNPKHTYHLFQRYPFHQPQPVHPYCYSMAANNDPQPSTSNGNTQQNGPEQLERTRTSTLAPLSEAEMAQLTKELGSEFGGSSGNPDKNLNHHESQTAGTFAEPKPPTNLPPAINLNLSSKPIAHKTEPFIGRGMSEHEICIGGTSEPK